MNIEREKRRCLPDAGRPHFSGGSSASSSTTNNYDQRVVGGDGSSNASVNVSGTENVLNVTDGGAVKSAVELAKTSVSTSAQTGLQLFQGAVSAVTESNKQLASAYQQGQAGDQVQLKYAGFVVIGLAAVMLLSKFKG